MTVNLDVYDTANSTLQGTLSEAFAIQFLDDLLIPGTATFKVDLQSSADIALLQPRRVVRFRTGATPGTGDVAAYLVQDRPAASELEVEGVSTVTFQCPHLLSWLGYREGGGVLDPYGGESGRQQDPRLFGPFAPDFDDSAWPNATAAGPLSTDGWPDEQAEALSFTNRAIFRRTTTETGVTGAARMHLVANWDVSAVVYRNGEIVLEKPWGETGLFVVDIPYDGLGDTFAIKAERPGGGPGRVGWAWMRLEVETDADGNEEFVVGTALRRTFAPADFPSADSYWLVLDDYTDMPGVTVGYVFDVALTEDDGRFSRPWSWTFDGSVDSDGQAWTVEFARGFRLQTLGRLLNELSGIEGEPEMTPAGEVRFVKARGSDKTATVTVSAPFGMELSGRGPVATRWRYLTDDGLGETVDAAAETALGVVMQRFVTLGNDIDPRSASKVVAKQLALESGVRDEARVDLPDDVVPYQDVVLGDTVSLVGRDGSAPYRFTSFQASVVDDNGHVDWSATLEPA